MTHDKDLQHGTCAAYQRSAGFDKAQKVCIRCSDDADQAIQYLQTPSLPLCARSRAEWQASSDSGQKDSFYSQTLAGSDSNTSSIFKFNGQDSERNRNPGAGSLFAKRSEAWLRGENALERSSWNTAMTGCHRKRSCKLIGSWSLIEFGKGVMKTDP